MTNEELRALDHQTQEIENLRAIVEADGMTDDLRTQAQRLVELDDRLGKDFHSVTFSESEEHYKLGRDGVPYARAYLAECEAHERTRERILHKCGSEEENVFEEVKLVSLPPELEALPDISAFAVVYSKSGPCWVPIRGKSVDIECVPMILHAGYPVNEGLWRVSEIQCGFLLVDSDDPVLAVESAREAIRQLGIERYRKLAEERLATLPPKPMHPDAGGADQSMSYLGDVK